jgi:hypothetical protein
MERMFTLLDCVEEDEEDEEFLRGIIMCEEERRRRYPTMPWVGGYRWFRSPKVIDLDKYRDHTAKERMRRCPW